MKKYAVLICLAWAVPAQAASIQNLDAKPYSLIVKSENEQFKTVIEPAGYIKDLCSFCTVEVEGYSISDIEDAPVFRLTNGVLTKTD